MNVLVYGGKGWIGAMFVLQYQKRFQMLKWLFPTQGSTQATPRSFLKKLKRQIVSCVCWDELQEQTKTESSLTPSITWKII